MFLLEIWSQRTFSWMTMVCATTKQCFFNHSCTINSLNCTTVTSEQIAFQHPHIAKAGSYFLAIFNSENNLTVWNATHLAMQPIRSIHLLSRKICVDCILTGVKKKRKRKVVWGSKKNLLSIYRNFHTCSFILGIKATVVVSHCVSWRKVKPNLTGQKWKYVRKIISTIMPFQLILLFLFH